MERKLIPLCRSPDGATEYMSDGSSVYARRGGGLYELAVFERNFYKLRLHNGVPLLEIDGLRMHLVKDFRTPLDYAREVVKALRIGARDTGRTTPDTVLDTCMGLGYTAIEASRAAGKVVTCEISRAVITLAEWNPWSEPLFKNKKIEILEGDISEKIKSMPGSSFDAVIHDPPRFSRAGELYSLAFYRELHRTMKGGGKLFHYVGSPGKGRGRDIASGVSARLAQAGFARIRYDERLQGIFAGSPSSRPSPAAPSRLWRA